MKLGRLVPATKLQIWEPRWNKQDNNQRHVLLACYKVDDASPHLQIEFTKAKSMTGDWYISKTVAQSCPKTSNGTIMCYKVPLNKLEVLERED